MIINYRNESATSCCYNMFEFMLAYGVNIDWAYCPYCGRKIEVITDTGV